jgi:DNA-binding response OmpR family regulator
MAAKKKSKKQYLVEIVEDDVYLLSTLTRAFEAEGIKVLQAKDGKEGYDIAIKNQPDAILLDIVMPVMSGLEMLTKLRKDAWGKDAMVMVLSNLGDADTVRETNSKKVGAFFIKADWKLDAIISEVKKRLDGTVS